MIELDGSRGEGGGQILRSALALSAITGQPFRIVRIRANRSRPGLRPQHLACVRLAAEICAAETRGATEGSRELLFEPGPVQPVGRVADIGTAGATALLLHAVYLPLAWAAPPDASLELSLGGGTFNDAAPSFPHLVHAWAPLLRAIGLDVRLRMPRAGFFPRGGGRLLASVSGLGADPARLRPLRATRRGPLRRLVVEAGVAELPPAVADRMIARLLDRVRTELPELAAADPLPEPETALRHWRARSPGAFAAIVAECEDAPAPLAFVALGERGKPAERVADEAFDELARHFAHPGAVVDLHAADQILLPLALVPEPSAYAAPVVTEHLRTNAGTIAAFLPRRSIAIEPDDHGGAIVRVS